MARIIRDAEMTALVLMISVRVLRSEASAAMERTEDKFCALSSARDTA